MRRYGIGEEEMEYDMYVWLRRKDGNWINNMVLLNQMENFKVK